MNDNNDLLSELEIKQPQKTKTYYALLVSIAFYVIVFLLQLLYNSNIKPISFKRSGIVINWGNLSGLLLLFTLPIIGFLFLINKKKIGWALCLIYFIPASIMFLIAIGYNGFTRGFTNNIQRIIEVFLITASALVSMILLLLKNIRQYFSIQKKQLRISLGISSVLAIIIIILFMI